MIATVSSPILLPSWQVLVHPLDATLSQAPTVWIKVTIVASTASTKPQLLQQLLSVSMLWAPIMLPIPYKSTQLLAIMLHIH